jgi:lysozyme
MAQVKIIDVSSNNGVVDFNKVKAAGVERCFIRTSLGYGTLDKDCIANANAVEAAGISPSYYHFAYPDTKSGGNVVNDATAEANYFCDCLEKVPAFEFLAVDCEPFSSSSDTPLSPDDYALWLTTFLNTVKARNGADCLVYTYADYLNHRLPDNHLLGSYRLWIANYENIPNPPCPKGWADWFMWQYNEIGTVDGITGHVDCTMLNPNQSETAATA